MKQYKVFFTRVIMLIVVMALADIAIGHIISYVFNKQKSGKYFITTTAISHANQDVIIIGNSHAAENFDAPLIQQKLNRSTFDFGVQGQSMLYYYPILKSILAYHTPKLIIFNVDCLEFRYNVFDYQRMNIFLPYFRSNKYIDSSISLIGGSSSFMKWSALYRYNSTLGYVFFNTSAKNYNKSYRSLGYDPQEGSICKGGNNELNGDVAKAGEKIRMDTLKMKLFVSIIKEIQARKIPVLITSTPLYTGYPETDPYWSKLISVIKELNLNYFNDVNDKGFIGKCNLFLDDTHLNKDGASVYTDSLINKIQHSHILN